MRESDWDIEQTGVRGGRDERGYGRGTDYSTVMT